jgi:hypothetical protein
MTVAISTAAVGQSMVCSSQPDIGERHWRFKTEAMRRRWGLSRAVSHTVGCQ